MALTPQNSDAFFREVDEEVRRDQMIGLWSRYGKALIAAVVIALAALAAWLWWRHAQEQAAGRDGEALVQVIGEIAAGRPAPAGLATLASSPRDGYRAAAGLVEAAAALEKTNVKAAAARYAEIAADTTLPTPFRDLARVRRTAAEFDTLPPQQVVALMRPLVVPGGHWLGSAGELMAAAQAKAGDLKGAAATFGLIAADPATPETIRLRAARQAASYAAPIAAAPAEAGR